MNGAHCWYGVLLVQCSPSCPASTKNTASILQPRSTFNGAGNNSQGVPTVYVLQSPGWEDASSACREWGGSLFIPSMLEDLQLFKQAVAESRRWHQGQLRDISTRVWVGARHNNLQDYFEWLGDGISKFAGLSDFGLIPSPDAAVSALALDSLPQDEPPWFPGTSCDVLNCSNTCLQLVMYSNLRSAVWLKKRDCKPGAAFACIKQQPSLPNNVSVAGEMKPYAM